MNGFIAQLVALTCHGNAVLRGINVPPFFPDNSTCRFAEYVSFWNAKGRVELAATPDLWFESLPPQGVKGLLLHQLPSGNAEIDDRMSAGFVGGGKAWRLEAVEADGKSDFWSPEKELGDQNAPERRIWRTRYYRYPGDTTDLHGFRSLSATAADFETALEDIHAFSARHPGNEGFTSCFANGLKALRGTDYRPEYHQDLYPPHTLSNSAQSLLSAASAAWVFGGMGSWNDLGFIDDQDEYDRVSATLYNIINEAIAVAASSSWPGSGIG